MPEFRYWLQGVVEGPDEAVVVGALMEAIKHVEIKVEGKLFDAGTRSQSVKVAHIEPKAST